MAAKKLQAEVNGLCSPVGGCCWIGVCATRAMLGNLKPVIRNKPAVALSGHFNNLQLLLWVHVGDIIRLGP